MATKLEELEVTSVDFVDRGANPDARISLFKRDSGGDPYEADAPDEPPKQGVWKRFLNAIGRWAGVSQDDIDAVAEEIEKAEAPDGEDDPDEGPEEGTSGSSETDDTDDAGGEEPEEEAGVSKSGPKGERVPMVDVSRMTPAEKMFYEDIVKRYSTEEAQGEEPAADPVEKAAGEEAKAPEAAAPVAEAAGTDDIYKGLHPLVAAELKALRKRADEEDEKALNEVAKKYAIIGKKPEELVPVLKSLKAAGGTAYDDMISVLDASVEAVNKSGIFEEIGKSGGYGTAGAAAGSATEAKVAAIAKGIMQEDPAVTPAQALARAWESSPELWDEYEREAGF